MHGCFSSVNSDSKYFGGLPSFKLCMGKHMVTSHRFLLKTFGTFESPCIMALEHVHIYFFFFALNLFGNTKTPITEVLLFQVLPDSLCAHHVETDFSKENCFD